MGKNNSSFGKGWDGGPGRAGSKRSRTGAGAPVPTPRSPRARRFRRIRPLSCTPTVQVPRIRPLRPLYLLRTQLRLPTSISPCSRRCLGFPPHHHDPPATDSASLAYSNARVRTFDSDCAVWQGAAAAGAAAMVSDTSSATAQLPAAHASPLYTHPTRGQRSSTAGFRGS
jgi:hypothetical protein